MPILPDSLKPAARYPASVAASSIWKSRPVKLGGNGMSSAVPGVKSSPASFQVASTCPKAISGLASVASMVAWALKEPDRDDGLAALVDQALDVRRVVRGALRLG